MPKLIDGMGEELALFEFKRDFCIAEECKHVSEVVTMFIHFSRKQNNIVQVYYCKPPIHC